MTEEIEPFELKQKEFIEENFNPIIDFASKLRAIQICGIYATIEIMHRCQDFLQLFPQHLIIRLPSTASGTVQFIE